MHSLTKISLAGIVLGAFALGGCATNDATQKAQASADQATQQAQAANAAAQKAQASADQAQSEIQSLNAKFDSLMAMRAEHAHAHEHHEMAEHHHGHHHKKHH